MIFEKLLRCGGKIFSDDLVNELNARFASRDRRGDGLSEVEGKVCCLLYREDFLSIEWSCRRKNCLGYFCNQLARLNLLEGMKLYLSENLLSCMQQKQHMG